MYPRHTTVLLLCAAMAFGAKASLTAGGAGTDSATLRRIASSVDTRTGVIAIEASAPVAYVAAQPEPRTFVIELRDVEARGFANQFKRDPRHPFSSVAVESGQTADGLATARVTVALTAALRPRVRSSRNIIYIEADRIDRAGARLARAYKATGISSTVGPASAILHIAATRRGATTAVTLYGSGRLNASNVVAPQEGSPRIVIDLANATSTLPATSPVHEDPVDQVHIGLSAKSPLVTQVVLDLTRRAPYHVESSENGHELTVVFDSTADPALLRPVAARVVPPASMTQGPPPTTDVSAQPGLQVGPPPGTRALPEPAFQGQGPQAAPPVAQTTAAPAPQVPAPAAPQTPPSASRAQGQAPPPAPAAQRFTGFPISLDFQGADLRAVLRTFSEISGLNIVIDPTIQGTVDVALRDVPWDQALDIILRANKLGYTLDGTIVRIVPMSVLAQEQAERQKLAEAQALAGELQTRTYTLSYARADALAPLIEQTVLSRRGTPRTDERTNTLIITDLPEQLDRAAALIATLDRPEPQVEIEARIVQTTRDFAQKIGVQWGFTGRADPQLGNTLPLAFPNQATVGGRTGGGTAGVAPGGQREQGPTPAEATSTLVNLGVTGATTGVGLALGAINGALNLDAVLTALETSGQGRLLSTPKVTTQNNIEAQITQGIQIPIQTVANNTVTVTFRDAALTLLVRPQITAANTVIMQITVENAAADFSRSINGIPPIDTQRALTKVLVNNGETTVIGGIYVSREQTQQARTPGLYRIPLLGWLFQRNEISDESRELLIFITPRIIRP